MAGLVGGDPVVTVDSDAELVCCLCLNLIESLLLGGVGGVDDVSRTDMTRRHSTRDM